MLLKVKSLTGSVMEIEDIKPTDTLQQVKEIIHEKTNIEPGQMKLLYKGTSAADGKTVSDYGMKGGEMLYMVVVLR